EEEDDGDGLQALKQGGSVKAGQPGSSCAHSGECEYGLFCDIRGLGGVCAKAGTADLDQSCLDEDGVATSRMCLAGLVCSKLSETCVPGSLLLNPDLFEGIRCWEGAEAEMPFGVRTFIPPLDTTGGSHPSVPDLLEEGADPSENPYADMDEGSLGGCYAIQTIGDLCTTEDECSTDADCDDDGTCLLPEGFCRQPDMCGDDICGDDGVCRRCIADVDYDFYSLPFPNDIRTNKEEGEDRHMVIGDHPRPGPGLLGLDPIDSVIEAIGEELHGWSIQPGIFMRFTRPVQVDTLTPGQNVRLVYIPPQGGPVPGIASEHPFEVTFVPERGKYICNNQLVAHPVWSKPLAPNSTYAFVVTTDVRSESVVDANACETRPNPELAGGFLAGCAGCWCEDVVCRANPECCDAGKSLVDPELGEKGWNQACVDACTSAGQTCNTSETPQQLDHLPMLLSSTAPEDSALAPAWESYERFRQWLETDSLTADQVAGVTLFTTGDPTELMGKVQDAIEARYEPSFAVKNSKAQVHNCRLATGPSPCGDPGWSTNELSEGGTIPDPRLCPDIEDQSDWYDEWHIRLKIPKIQAGKRPYLQAGTGGEVDEGMVNDSTADLATETICVSLTVPTADPPEDGYPVMVYGHGTGGSFRTAPTLLGSV
ncbi:MAG: Ig-like domain-containing protein, partial [Myxococcota bacterium]|nr:Ig-like domain-containing protein [Myxococcota bacterium]